MTLLALLFHMAVITPDHLCGPAIEAGTATGTYYVAAAPTDVDDDDADDSLGAGGTCATQVVPEQPSAFESTIAQPLYIA